MKRHNLANKQKHIDPFVPSAERSEVYRGISLKNFMLYPSLQSSKRASLGANGFNYFLSKLAYLTCWLLLPLNITGTDNNTLAVAIMVKNEAAVLAKTLEPFIKAGVTQFLVYDTGSTDGTPDVAQHFFTEHHLTDAHIVKEQFIDFATSRNNALKIAEKRFANTTFIVMPDAEWYLNNPEKLRAFCKQEQDAKTEAYMMLVRNKKEQVYRPALFRRNAHVRFKGAVHEYVTVPVDIVPDHIFFTWGVSEKGREKTRERFIRDRDCLLKSYAKDPRDAHTLFFLGQTYSCLNDHHNAYKYYKEALPLPAGDENKFETLYRIGREVEELCKTDLQFSWALAQDYYLQAYAMRPKRAEPLIRIAGYYIKQKQHAVAFIFARHACELPLPSGEFNFVEIDVYTFDRYAALSTCAWAVGEDKTGLWAAEKALAVRPEVDYLYDHRKYYLEKTGGKK